MEVNLLGLQKNSSSNTDTYILIRKNPKTNEIVKTFIKMWIKNIKNESDFVSSDDRKHIISNSSKLKYEAEVYKYIKQEILDKGISNSFVKLVRFKDHITYEDFKNFILQSVVGIDHVSLEKAIKRNVYSLIFKDKHYPITDITDLETLMISDEVNDIINSVEFSYIETQLVEPYITLYEFLIKNEKQEQIEIIRKLFKAVDIMNSKGIFHQDLHFNNVLVLTDKTIKIFDYDRAYLHLIGPNKFSTEIQCENNSQCPTGIEDRPNGELQDFIKIICQLFKLKILTKDQVKIILDCSPETSELTNWVQSEIIDEILDSFRCFMKKDNSRGYLTEQNTDVPVKEEIKVTFCSRSKVIKIFNEMFPPYRPNLLGKRVRNEDSFFDDERDTKKQRMTDYESGELLNIFEKIKRYDSDDDDSDDSDDDVKKDDDDDLDDSDDDVKKDDDDDFR